MTSSSCIPHKKGIWNESIKNCMFFICLNASRFSKKKETKNKLQVSADDNACHISLSKPKFIKWIKKKHSIKKCSNFFQMSKITLYLKCNFIECLTFLALFQEKQLHRLKIIASFRVVGETQLKRLKIAFKKQSINQNPWICLAASNESIRLTLCRGF